MKLMLGGQSLIVSGTWGYFVENEASSSELESYSSTRLVQIKYFSLNQYMKFESQE